MHINKHTRILENIDLFISRNKLLLPLSYDTIDCYLKGSYITSIFGANSNIQYWYYIYDNVISRHDSNKTINILKHYLKDDIVNIYVDKYSIDHNTLLGNRISFPDIVIKVRHNKYTSELATSFSDCEGIQNGYGNNEKFHELCEICLFNNYYIHTVSYDEEYGQEYFVITCRASRSISITGFSYKNPYKEQNILKESYNDKLYYICSKEEYGLIQHRGLIANHNGKLYGKYIEPRLNLFLGNCSEEIIERAKMIANLKHLDDYIILCIDTDGNTDFYHDEIHPLWYVYTYGLIHPRQISEYKC